MDVENLNMRTERTADHLHLWGGLRAGTDQEGCLFVSASLQSGRGIQFSTVKNTHRYRQALLPHGLDIVGWEVLSPLLSVSHIISSITPAVDAVRNWGWLVNEAMATGDLEGAELARNVAFALQRLASAFAIFRKHTGCKSVRSRKRYENWYALCECGDLQYISGIARIPYGGSYSASYLAVFIAQRILQGPAFSKVRRMSDLREVLSKAERHSALADYILTACDKDHTGAWMAQLGEYRNKVIHEAPISVMGPRFLEVKPVTIGSRTLPRIYMGMPVNPFSARPVFADALEHFRMLTLRLLELPQWSSSPIPIRPKPGNAIG